MSKQEPIAIVGIGGIFPDAPTLDRFWENLAGGFCSAREVPDGRWILSKEQAFDPRRGAPDKVYSLKACFIEGFSLDPAGLELPPAFLERLDPSCALALHAARAAFLDGRGPALDRARVGVAIGHIVLPTESASALAREWLLPAFEEKALGCRLSPPEKRVDPINRYAAGLPAGLIARALGLGGGAFALDAACASSLYALKLAADELRSGRLDAVLAGGVSRPDSLYTQMGFSQLRALSPSGRPSPFDASADGLVVGEGAGMFLLKRREDALRDGDRIYGLIVGAGLSNDVGGSLLAPNTPGQLRAMREAYRAAGWSPDQVDTIECHATGTPTGDPIELASLKALWGERGWRAGQCPIGSVKSNVGHLLTAAGSAGLMKLLLALKHDELPPTANLSRPSSALGLEESPFRVPAEKTPWTRRDARTPRRAAISAFGFGGINAHLLIEENLELGRAVKRGRARKPDTQIVPIAIVGMEAHFGSLVGLRRFQEAVLSSSTPEPVAQRDPLFGNSSNPLKGHFLTDLSVSPDSYRIPPKELEESLPQQLVMLECAAGAIKDAGLKAAGPGQSPFPVSDRTGVFVGLGLDLNTTNFHFRWALAARAKGWARELKRDLSEEGLESWIAALREAAGPALSANRTMGALGGIVASRIAREFHLGGPSFTISSEDSSGLRALELAARALQRGELDAALVGAVDIAGDPRALRGTDAARPFTRAGRAAPFDAQADGPLPGEGAAALVLKRLDDALRDGDRVYAVIRGLGAATGGGCDQGAASAEACAAAARRAYAEAGVDPSTITWLEAHAGGSPEEDRAEASALAETFGTATSDPRCAIGTLKSAIGHAGAASGLAGVVRAALALYQEILPPGPSLGVPREELARARKRFHLTRRPQYWLRNRAEGPRRAAVNALSIDGTCLHAVLESIEGVGPSDQLEAERRQPLGARAEALFCVEEDGAEGLLAGLRELGSWAAEQSGLGIESLARRWWLKRGSDPRKRLAVALVARDFKELAALVRQADESIRENPERPIPGDRVHLTTRPGQGPQSVAFVFPGSGNQFLGMGVELGAQWPEILRAQDLENGFLRHQLVPHRTAPWRFSWPKGWPEKAESELGSDYRAMIFSSVALGTVVSDLLRRHGVEPRYAIGYSLGETASLFSLRAWTDRDEMLRRMRESSLFVSDLAGPCDAARRFWNLPPEEKVDWVLGVIDRPADSVKKALKGMERAALLIVNAPLECVVGGYKGAVESLVEGLGCVFLPLQGVSTVHFPAAKLVEKQYRDLHLLPTRAPEGVRVYSGASGKSYQVGRESCADSITAQAVRSFDFSALIRNAYQDGARLFVETGPQGSCSRMIGKILGPNPHLARSVCVKGTDEVSSFLKTLAQLVSERVPVDLKQLYGLGTRVCAHQEQLPSGSVVRIPLGLASPTPVAFPSVSVEKPVAVAVASPSASQAPPRFIDPGSINAPASSPVSPRAVLPASMPSGRGGHVAIPSPVLAAMLDARAASAKAHETYLRIAQNFNEAATRTLSGSATIPLPSPAPSVAPVQPEQPPRALDREQCMTFAVGKIGDVLGRLYAEIDAYPTRVRLPDEPLMLVDRILEIEGEPLSLASGRVVTEHDVLPGKWYLDGGRIPTCVAVEAGQADLFLSGYLGIDLKTKGLAVYRLLDAEVSFHGPLPRPGETIHYDIRIERFVQHDDAWLFFFNYDGTVDGKPLITMRKGCAGFFTADELSRGKGVVRTAEELAPVPGKRPSDWNPLAPFEQSESLSDDRVAALRAGNLASAFGPAFSKLPIRKPSTLPSGLMKLVDRVLEMDPKGGRYGLGKIRAEADIKPDDWHLTCHFVDDNVMPGTLMYECCLHTLRVFLMRMGWIGEEGAVAHEPKPGVRSQLKCRGQVLASTKKVMYEVEIKELGYDPEPYAIADALMYSDGKPIVQISDMSIRLGGTDRETIEKLWSYPQTLSRTEFVDNSKPLFDNASIMAFATGKPSEAFGAPYKVFDSERVIARLPGPPYKFLDRIVSIEGCRPFELKAGGAIVAEYDVPPGEWYFADYRQPTMPFSILLEVALQPCGWLAAYLGSALTSPIDLSFRNLGGTGTLLREVTPDSGTLSIAVKLTKVSQSGGMIIQNFDFAVSDREGLVYQGVTEFGFFTKEALSTQLGIRGAKPKTATKDGSALALDGLPNGKLTMLDEAIACGDGLFVGRRRVDSSEWFFKAHFFQDPVCPGSLGLESFVHLMKLAALQRWPERAARFESMALGRPHKWLYRGQYTPVNKQVELSCVVKSAESGLLVADGFLTVDGLTIYQMSDFAVRLA